MEVETLKKSEGRKVRIVLKNNFVYSSIVFKITEENLVEFTDKFGEVISIEPSFISMISQWGEE